MYFLWFCHGAVDSSVSSPNASDTKFPISTMYNPFLGASIWLPSMTWRRRMLDRLLPQLSHKQDRIRLVEYIRVVTALQCFVIRVLHVIIQNVVCLPSGALLHVAAAVVGVHRPMMCCCGGMRGGRVLAVCLLSVLLVAFVWGGGEGRGSCGSALNFVSAFITSFFFLRP